MSNIHDGFFNNKKRSWQLTNNKGTGTMSKGTDNLSITKEQVKWKEEVVTYQQ